MAASNGGGADRRAGRGVDPAVRLSARQVLDGGVAINRENTAIARATGQGGWTRRSRTLKDPAAKSGGSSRAGSLTVPADAGADAGAGVAQKQRSASRSVV